MIADKYKTNFSSNAVYHSKLDAFLPSEFLVFPDKHLPCASVYKELASGQPVSCNKRRHCNHAHLETPTSLIRMLQCISSAETEILICMYSFTFDKLADLLIAKKRKGCRVQIITDPSREGNESDQISILKSKGFDIRERGGKQKDKYKPKMHNKFVIIDNSMVMHGSANWSLSGILHNNETVVISHEKLLIEDFRAYFEKLWSNI